MTIEEAIKYNEEIAEENEKICLYTPIDFCNEEEIDQCSKSVEVSRQLAGWLKELVRYRKALLEIREEIASYKDDKLIHAERNEMIDIVLEIIDKYRGESEVKK